VDAAEQRATSCRRDIDVAHEEALRRRLEGSLRAISHPVERIRYRSLVQAAQERYEAAAREEERSTRLILEFGTELSETDDAAAGDSPTRQRPSSPPRPLRLRPFCRLVEVRRGRLSSSDALPPELHSLGQLVKTLALSTRPAADARAAPRHVASVTWAEALSLPPLEILFTASDGASSTCRRLVVQLPHPPEGQGLPADEAAAQSLNISPDSASASGAAADGSLDGCVETNGSAARPAAAEVAAAAAPVGGARSMWLKAKAKALRQAAMRSPCVLYDAHSSLAPEDAIRLQLEPRPQDVMSSGWVVMESTGAPRVHRGRLTPGLNGAAAFAAAARAAADNVAVCTLLEASSPSTGSVAEATLQLLQPALAGQPSDQLIAAASALQLCPLARSVECVRELRALYEEIGPQVSRARSQRVREGASLEPRGFFHVAIDCPGLGRSAGDATAMAEAPDALLADVVRSLGKRHAFAIVGAARGAACVLRAVATRPGLANFVAVLDPTEEKASVCLTVLQPTLIVVDAVRSATGGDKVQAERLRRSLPIASLIEASDTAPMAKLIASHLLALFEAHEWRAHLPGLGATKLLPLLSRPAGGVNAWAKLASMPLPQEDDEGGPVASTNPRPRAGLRAGPKQGSRSA